MKTTHSRMAKNSARALKLTLLLAIPFVAACRDKEEIEEIKKQHANNKENPGAHSHSHGDGHSHSHSHGDGHSHSDGHSHGDGHGHGHSHDDDHGHDHTPHSGVVTPLMAGDAKAGFAELKLHDDKGDLELWLTEDEAGTKPLDMPLDAVITVTFPKLDKKVVQLKIRNGEKNEDEDGKGNIRDGKTNYFIFPGDTGADASWLMGKEFAAEVVITFSTGDVSYSTAAFELKPHTH